MLAVILIELADDGGAIDSLRQALAIAEDLDALLTLALLSVAGYGWARIGVRNPVVAAGVAPAVGAAVLIVVAVALDAVGLALGEAPAAVAASVACAGGGYLLRFVLERRAGA